MKTLLIAAMLAGTAFSAPALAQTTPPDATAPAPDTGRMRHMDQGPITRDDFLARADKRFARMDADADGSLAGDELTPKRAKGGDGAAAPADGGRFAQRMLAQLDTNHDGKISRDEMRAEAAARFDTADTNHDGTLDPTEQEAMRGKMMHRMYGMPKHRGAAGAGADTPPPPGDQPQPDTDQ